MRLQFADTIQPQKVEWLWPGYLPRGKVVMLDGDPGLGKSTLLCDIAARLSSGRELPGGKLHEPMGVLLMMGEDGTGDTTVPRLMAAGAVLSRIAIRENYSNDQGQEEPPAFPNDLHRLQADIDVSEAQLVVIDPIMSYLAEDINANSDQQVRRALMPLKDLAETTGATIVLVRHLNKMAGGNSLYRGGGSIGFVGVARVALIMAKHPEDESRRVLAVNKTNLMALPPALAFSLEDSGQGAAIVVWEGTTGHTAESLVGRDVDDDRSSALDEALAFLLDLLADGPVLSTAVQRAAKDAGLAWDTVRRAQRKLRIVPEKAKTQDGKWVWPQLGEGVDDPPASTASTGSTISTASQYNNNNSNRHLLDIPGSCGLVEVVEPVEASGGNIFGRGVDPLHIIGKNGGNIPVALVGGKAECAECGRTIIRMAGQALVCKQCLDSTSARAAD